MSAESCFKTYDIRGIVPEQLNNTVAERVGRSFCTVTGAKSVVVGYDARISSPKLAASLIEGLTASGADVFDIGLCGTEEIYHAAFSKGLDGGIMVTASHNPEEWNGMKLIGRDARPLDPEGDLAEIKKLVESDFSFPNKSKGEARKSSFRDDYISYLLSFIDPEAFRGLKILVNSGNGCAGPVVDLLEKHLPCSFVKVHHDPDGTFPNGIPNPLLPENRGETSALVASGECDLGIAFDGDFDRCFFYDENGDFVDGYYIVAMLAEMVIGKNPGARIVHDPRLYWNTIEVVKRMGGEPCVSRTGHVFIKKAMRDQDAVYGGEMSGHHYYRDFGYCDSGMLTWLLAVELLGKQGSRLSEKIGGYKADYPISGEINRTIADSEGVLGRIRSHYESEAKAVSFEDGLSMSFEDWRFNVRSSSTEPLVRLNVESRSDKSLVDEKTREILQLMG